MMKKKLITLLLAVSLVVTLTPAMAFADESDGQQDTGQVVQMESQEEVDEALVTEVQEDAEQQPVVESQDIAEPESVDLQDEPLQVEAEEDDAESLTIEADGTWVKKDNYWQYIINGSPAKLWNYIGSAWYYFGSDGNMQTGIQRIGSYMYYLGTNGDTPGAAGSNLGAMQIGLQTVNGKTYFLNMTGTNPSADTLGAMQVDVVFVPGTGYCYFDTVSTNYGVMRTGWVDARRGRCYFDPANRGIMTVGMKKIGSNTYIFADNGVMRKGWCTLGNNKYYLGSNGVMMTGWQTISGDKYYFNTSSGVMTKGGPVKIGKSKYYFNASNGKMVKGWQTISGSRYFFNTSNGTMHTGWLTYKGKKYYLQSSGKAKIGLATIKGNRYFFQSDASMMRNSAVKVKGKLYYFLKNGKGYKKKGWFKGSDGGKRYSLGKGRVQTGKKKIKGIWYQFNKYTGIAKTLGDSFDISIQSMTSQTKYLITINRSKCELRVYQGKKDNWTRIKTMSCGVGAPSTPTPAGTFVTNSRMQVNAYTLNGTKVRYWYHTQFYSEGNKGIHSGLYYVDTGEPYDVATKTKNSQGSVRVDLNNAEWIYYNVPLSTTVYIK